MEQRHQIRTLKLKLYIRSKADTQEVFESGKAIIQRWINEELEAILSELSPTESAIEIPSINLDLGSLYLQDLSYKIGDALRRELGHKIQDIESTIAKIPLAERSETALVFFLENGYFPWYQNISNITTRHALSHWQRIPLDKLRSIFEPYVNRPKTRKRILEQLPSPLNKSLAKLLLNNHYQLLRILSNDLLLLNRINPIVEKQRLATQLEKAILSTAFTVLLEKQRQTSKVVTFFLKQLGGFIGLDPQLVWAHFARTIQAAKLARKGLDIACQNNNRSSRGWLLISYKHLSKATTLRQNITSRSFSKRRMSQPKIRSNWLRITKKQNEIHAQLQISSTKSLSTPEGSKAVHYFPANTPFASLQYFLKAGYLPFSEIITSFQSLESWLQATAEEGNEQLFKALKDYLANEVARRRIAYQFSEKTFQAILGLISPDQQSTIIALQQEIATLLKLAGIPAAVIPYLRMAILAAVSNLFISEKTSITNLQPSPKLLLEEAITSQLLDQLKAPWQLKLATYASQLTSKADLAAIQLNILDTVETHLAHNPIYAAENEADSHASITIEEVLQFIRETKTEWPKRGLELLQKLNNDQQVELKTGLKKAAKTLVKRWNSPYPIPKAVMAGFVKLFPSQQTDFLAEWQMEMAVLHWEFKPATLSAKQLESLFNHSSLFLLVSEETSSLEAWWPTWLSVLSKEAKVSKVILKKAYATRLKTVSATNMLSESFGKTLHDQLQTSLLQPLEESNRKLPISPQFAALQTFLRTGTYQTGLSPQRLIADIIKKDVTALAAWIIAEQQSLPKFLPRLEEWSDQSMLESLLVQGLKRPIEELKTVAQNLLQLFNAQADQWAVNQKSLWLLLLRYSVEHPKAKYVNAKAIRWIVERIAQQKGKSYPQVQEYLRTQFTIQKPKTEFEKALTTLLFYLPPKDEAAIEQYIDTQLKSLAPKRAINDLLYRLGKDEWPWWRTKVEADLDIQAILQLSFSGTQKAANIQSLKKTLAQPLALDRWMVLSNPQQQQLVLDEISGGYGDLLQAVQELNLDLQMSTRASIPSKTMSRLVHQIVVQLSNFSTKDFIQAWLLAVADLTKQSPNSLAKAILWMNPKDLYQRRIHEVIQQITNETPSFSADLETQSSYAFSDGKSLNDDLSMANKVAKNTPKAVDNDEARANALDAPNKPPEKQAKVSAPPSESIKISKSGEPLESESNKTNMISGASESIEHSETAGAKKASATIPTSDPNLDNVSAETPDESSPTISNKLLANNREKVQAQISNLFDFLSRSELPEAWSDYTKADCRRLADQLLRYHPNLFRKMLEKVARDKTTPQLLRQLFSTNLQKRRVLKVYLNNYWNTYQALFSDLNKLLPGLLPQYREADFSDWLFNFNFSHQLAPTALFEPIEAYLVKVLSAQLREYHIQPTSWLELAKEKILADPKEWKMLVDLWPEVEQQLRLQQSKSSAKVNPSSGQSHNAPIDASLFIHNAGLVLTAPFLPRYFSLLGMLDESKNFHDEETAARAVHLVQYLASGRSETSEDLLVFNKILCGLPLDYPVAAGIELSEAEESNSKQLLISILANWPIMNNSTIDNLRGSFLLREGRLTEEDDNWLLQPSTQAYDIALDYIPYSISMIKLPWVTKRIEVNWTTK